jgi:septin family protein
MSLGQTGVGKTTLIDSLFNMKFPDVSTRSHSLSNVDVLCHNYELQERNIKLKLGLVESRGFGDQINKGLNLFLTLIFSTFISFLILFALTKFFQKFLDFI